MKIGASISAGGASSIGASSLMLMVKFEGLEGDLSFEAGTCGNKGAGTPGHINGTACFVLRSFETA